MVLLNGIVYLIDYGYVWQYLLNFEYGCYAIPHQLRRYAILNILA